MPEARWTVARLADLPDGWRAEDGTPVDEDEALATIGRRDPRVIAFGVAAFTAAEGDPLIMPHLHAGER